MPVFVTQTLETELEILLITESSLLSELIAKRLQQQSARVKSVSYQKFLTHHSQLLAQEWYKICFLIQHQSQTEKQPQLPHSLSLPPLPRSALVVMPITAMVQAGGEISQAWRQQLQQEIKWFNKYVENIGISRFIFYKDLAKPELYPAQYFFQELQKEWLLDPDLELNFQLAANLSSLVAHYLLQPQRHPRLIQGKARRSRVFLQKIQYLYAQYHQTKPLIKQLRLETTQHPILKLTASSLETKTVTAPIDQVGEQLMWSLRPLTTTAQSIQTQADPEVKSPQKSDLIRTWNQVKQKSRQLLKARMETEEDSDEVEADSITRQVEQETGARPKLEIKKPAVEEQKVEAQTNDEDRQRDEVKPKVKRDMNSLFSEYRLQQRRDHLQRLTSQTQKGLRKLQHHKLLFFGGLVITLMATGMLIFMGRLWWHASRVEAQLVGYLESRSLPITAQDKRLSELQITVERVDQQLQWLSRWLSLPVFPEVSQQIDLSRQLIVLIEQKQGFIDQVNQAYLQLMSRTEGSVFSSLQLVEEQAFQVFKTLATIQAELKNFPTQELSAAEKELLGEYQQQVVSQEKKMSQFRQLFPFLPQLLGQNQKQVYAVLLQNNHELRPTGGFLQAVALLTFDQGQLINIQTYDVYSLDRDLTAILEPPAEVRQYLGEERWFLRDSNWNPDFPQTAHRINWFLDKSLGLEVDGVIGLNLKVLSALLADLEQVELKEFNEVLTARNLEERMEYHSEVELVDTAQNHDYGELVLLRLLRTIEQLPTEKITAVLSTLAEMVENKEMLVTFFNPQTQQVVESLGWIGAVITPDCPTIFGDTKCVVDTMAQVEANVGVNKANYYLDRQVDHSIELQVGQVKHKRVVSYKNEAQTNAWPKGPYRVYTRFYLPQRAVSVEVKIDGRQLSRDQINIELEQGLERKVVGVMTETEVKTKTQLELTYTLPYDQTTPFTYVFFDQKQPGTRDVSPRVFLRHAPDLTPTLIAPQAEVQGDVIVFDPSQDTGHMFVGASFE